MLKLFPSILLLLLLVSAGDVHTAVLGVDMGSEWMRIGLVKPGVPMEIVLNKESRRKSPMNVYISKEERLIGDDSNASKKPQYTHKYFTRTLAALPSNPAVRDFQEDFPELRLAPDTQSPDNLLYATGYTAEEILGMMLNYSKQISEEFAELKPIRDFVLTVPPYFNQAQRRAVLRAANLSEIKVINLMNSNLAVALHYASFQRDPYKEKPITLLFFDMGATATVATVVKFEQPEGKNTIPKVKVLGTGFDRYLGGALIDKLLARHLASEFMKQQSGKVSNVLESHRAMAKLLKEAKRVKNVLSANMNHYAHVESLIDDKDMKILVTRNELESVCEEMFNRIPDVLNEAIEAAKIIPGELDSVVPVGGSSRVPKVQDIVLSTLNKSKFIMTINRDEAAAMGAIYLGASLTKGFRVQEFLLQDASIYPIEISYEKRIPIPKETEESEAGEYRTKVIHKTLFHRSNQLPQKKIMTFKNITKDLTLHASYVTDESWLDKYDREVLTQGRYPNGNKIARIDIRGVQEAVAEHGEDEFRGVKVHFSVDESGIFTCSGAEAMFEEKPSEKSTLDSLLSFFSSSEKESTLNETKPDAVNSTNNSNSTLDASTNTTRAENKTLKADLRTQTLEVITTLLDYPDPSERSMVQSRQKLLTLALRDEEKRLREIAQNNLEAFIYDLKERIYKDEAIAVTSEEQREGIVASVVRASEWLFEQDDGTSKEAFNEKYHELREITVDLYIRMRERREIPIALQKLNDTFNATEKFVESMAVYSNVSKLVFTEGDYKLLSRQYNETKAWLEKALAEQAKSAAYENPSLTVSLVDTQRAALENELRYLMNKLKYWKPVQPTSPPVAPTHNDTSSDEESIEVDLGEEEISDKTTEPENVTTNIPMDNVDTKTESDLPKEELNETDSKQEL